MTVLEFPIEDHATFMRRIRRMLEINTEAEDVSRHMIRSAREGARTQTLRRRQVRKMAKSGMSSEQIAAAMGLPESTVSFYRLDAQGNHR